MRKRKVFLHEKEYVRYFTRLIDLERKEEMEFHKKEIEKLSGSKREKKGRALIGLKFTKKEINNLGKVLIYLSREKDFPETEIKEGDVVVVSYKNPLEGGVQGNVEFIGRNVICLMFESTPHIKFSRKRTYRVDLYVNETTYTRMKEALNSVASKNTLFDLGVLFGQKKITRKESNIEVFYNPTLNESQKQAVRESIKTPHLYLIHGPPGTGKTTTLVEIALQLWKRGNKILVCADSNTAVDNFLQKTIPYAEKENINIVRIGSVSRIHKEIIPYSLDYKVAEILKDNNINEIYKEIEKKELELSKYIKPTPSNRRGLSHDEILKLALTGKGIRGLPNKKIKSMAKYIKLKREIDILKKKINNKREKVIKKIISDAEIIFSTNSTSGSEILKDTTFDVVIIDESTQATEPSALIPLVKGKKVILAGDHKQLPPTILSKKAKEEGLEISLFERLITTYPHLSALLNVQYRMNEKIMHFSNKTFYEKKLIAHEGVKYHHIPPIGIMSSSPVTYIHVPGREQRKGDSTSYYNTKEAEVIEEIVKQLLESVKEEDIGIISPYQDQVELLKKTLKKYKNIEIKTVDGFQGREKEIIILSLVRGNNNSTIGFLEDYRRLNVAITRARKKLIVVGNESTLSKDHIYKEFIEYIKNEGEYLVMG